ncbi:MAG: hypothetical protein GY845_26225 [Planctomycetes bacterium]|nr:hypothetical protein [Planctomycetota bacterium]
MPMYGSHLKQYVLLSVVFFSLIFVALGFGGGRSNLLPLGQNVEGGIEFDVIIVVNAPLVGSHIAIFGHYWITPSQYKAEFYWTEPSWMATNFFYPPSMTITDNNKTFRIKHELWNHDWIYKKPLQERGPFSHIANVYPMSDIRFATKEASENHLFLTDISSQNKETGASTKKRPKYQEIKKGQFSFRLHWTDGSLTKCDIYDKEKCLRKSVTYQYDKKTGCLQQQTIRLVQHNILVGDGDAEPYKIRMGQREYEFTYLPVPYHPNDRLCRVDYKPLRLAGKEVVLPVDIIVYQGDMSHLLRRAHFYNYRPLRNDSKNMFGSTELVYPFDDNYTKCKKEYIPKKWQAQKSGSTYIFSPSEKDDLADIYNSFLRQFEEGNELWEQLKTAKMLCHTAIMLGKEDDALFWLGSYFDLLNQLDLNEMVIKSGLDLCKTLGIWRDADFLHNIVPVWAQYSLKHNKPRELISFFNDSMIKQCRGHGRWYLYLFLNELTSIPQLGLDEQSKYDISFLKSVCLTNVAYRMGRKKPHADIEMLKSRYDDQEVVNMLEDTVEQTLKLGRNSKFSKNKKVQKGYGEVREELHKNQVAFPAIINLKLGI